jgi:hypothetical protein
MNESQSNVVPGECPSSSSKIIMAVVITAVIGLGAGYGIAKSMTKSSTKTITSSTTPSSMTKAADLRANLVTLGVEHMDLTDQAIDAALDGSPDAAALKTQLIANGTSISAAIGSVYGSAAQASFQKLWNTHLTDFINYAVADKEGNASAKAAALADIDANYTKPIAMLLSGANPNLPEATVETAFRDHVTMTAAVIDDHVAGNYTQEATDQAAAVTHIEGLMSTLAGAIVEQYPSKF